MTATLEQSPVKNNTPAPAHRYEMAAGAIMDALTSGLPAAKRMPPSSVTDPAVRTMLAYETSHGNIKLPPSPPTPPLSLAPQILHQIGAGIAGLSHEGRQGVLARLHDRLAQKIAEQGKVLAPDGHLHIVRSAEEASKLAQDLINQSIQEHSRREAEEQSPHQPTSGLGFNGPGPLARAQLPQIHDPLQRMDPGANPSAKADSAQAGLRGSLRGPQAQTVPAMGRNMTANAPVVRRVKAKARPVRGQTPEVKVKQEPADVQAALAQSPAPVSPEAASQIGQTDARSGRQILQPSDDLLQNERLAGDAAPYLTTTLSQVAASVPGARFDRLRPQKGLQRLQEKVADGKPPSTIGDNLAAQIVAKTTAAKDQLLARLQQQFPVISVDDKFLEPREKAGYPSTNVQLQMPNGGTAEVQIVTPEIQAITDRTHKLYTAGRRFPEGSADRAWYWNQAAAMHRAALERFLARNAHPPSSDATFAPGDKVILRNGDTAKIVGPSRDLRRVVVRTRSGLKTVRSSEVQN